jgi:hypothetical protein
VCYFAARWKGIYGGAAALLVSELAMNAYVLPASLRIARDSFGGFVASMVTYPRSLRPGAVWRRVRGARPGLETE